MNFEAIPPTLRIKRNWCVHRFNGSKSKVPHNIDGSQMGWSLPANWLTFEESKAAYLKGLELPEGHKRRFEGIGFFVSREADATLDIYCVDLDHCRNPETGEIEEWAKDILARLNSYSEVSPSKTGIHVFVRGMLPQGSKNTNDQMKDKNRVEIYTDKHHITVTGWRLLSYPETIEDRSEIIKAIYDEVLEVKAAKKEEKKQNKIKSRKILYDGKAEAKKKYVQVAIEDELQILRGAPAGERNNQLNLSAFAIGQFVGSGYLSYNDAMGRLESIVRTAGCPADKMDGCKATIRSGLDAGKLNPREIPEPEEISRKDPLPQIQVIPDVDSMIRATEQQLASMSDEKQKESIATVLVNLALKNSIETWHTPECEPYITVPINSHREHYRISTKSQKIKAWLGRLGRDLVGKTPSVSSIRDAINNLAGIAIYDGHEYQLYVRKAEIDGKIYVDLGDPSWKAVEISEDGWKVINDCNVHFRRSKNILPLPIPEKGGEIEELRALINVRTEENWILTLAWLSQAFWCRGPYAHLYLRGTQGTTKSYMMRVLKAISDPSVAINRRLPKTERDTAIALGSEAIPCFDNLSGIDDGIADLFCVASTGGVSTSRALFTDDEEALITLKCPIIANGIEDLGQRGDLLDRTIVLDLDPIPDDERKPEKEIMGIIEENRAKLFGALLDITVQGLNRIETVELENPPRMADFAEWACACLGNAAPRFIEIYKDARTNTSIDLVELNKLPAAIYGFVMSRPEKAWKGSASLLLAELNQFMFIHPGQEPRDWPTTPNKMGSELRRFTQALETKGIQIKNTRLHGNRVISLKFIVTSVTQLTPKKPTEGDKGDKGDNYILKSKIKDIIRGVDKTPPELFSEKTFENTSSPLLPSTPDNGSGVSMKKDDVTQAVTLELTSIQKAKLADEVSWILRHQPRKEADKWGLTLEDVLDRSKLPKDLVEAYLVANEWTSSIVDKSGLRIYRAPEKAKKAIGVS